MDTITLQSFWTFAWRQLDLQMLCKLLNWQSMLTWMIENMDMSTLGYMLFWLWLEYEQKKLTSFIELLKSLFLSFAVCMCLTMVIVTLPIEILSIEERIMIDSWSSIEEKRRKEKIKSSSQEQLIVLWSISIDWSPLNRECRSSDVHLDYSYIHIYIHSENNHTSITWTSHIFFNCILDGTRASREGDHFKLDEYSITSNPTEQGVHTYV